jgi:hypothetical protein
MSALLLLLCACGDLLGPTEAGFAATDFAPEPGLWLQFGPEESPREGPFLMIEVSAVGWELRWGETWNGSEDREVLPWSEDDGLALGGALLLPAEVAAGSVQDGVEVLGIGDEEVYYGTFQDAARSAVPTGRAAGEQVFARDFGPIRLSLDDQAWELVYYQ